MARRTKIILCIVLLAASVGGCNVWENYTATLNKITTGEDFEPRRWGESWEEYETRTGYASPLMMTIEKRAARREGK